MCPGSSTARWTSRSWTRRSTTSRTRSIARSWRSRSVRTNSETLSTICCPTTKRQTHTLPTIYIWIFSAFRRKQYFSSCRQPYFRLFWPLFEMLTRNCFGTKCFFLTFSKKISMFLRRELSIFVLFCIFTGWFLCKRWYPLFFLVFTHK